MRTSVSTVVLCIACIGAASLPAANTTAADSAAKELVIVSRHADVAGVVVSSIEGKPMHGTLVLKPMLKGEQMTLLELHYQPGTKAPLHTHSHESIIYVVSGRVRTWIGDHVYDLGPGDVARHPAGALHTVEGLVESTIIEIKSPAPDIATFIRAREQK
jgi:quercetin dioxygenase-like cupin family protein